jgi:putative ABC transport system substrate-binding protein
VLPDPLTGSHRSAIIDLAAKARMPTMYGYREYVDDGGFMAYGPNYRAVFRRAAVYVDKILKGSKPAEVITGLAARYKLPAVYPARF